MTTEAKPAANQANATKSAGPHTPEGKAKSACNATTHGLFAATPIVREADRPVYDEMAAALQESIFANLLARRARSQSTTTTSPT
jgi:hypothetical protein